MVLVEQVAEKAPVVLVEQVMEKILVLAETTPALKKTPIRRKIPVIMSLRKIEKKVLRKIRGMNQKRKALRTQAKKF